MAMRIFLKDIRLALFPSYKPPDIIAMLVDRQAADSYA